jgi:eukaryotic-like serine/threonine-protein kinase
VRLTPGSKLGPYEVLSLIGAGGMGEVYRARDSRLNRDVAIKVLPPELTRDAAAHERFEREARAVAALSHPSILAIFDVGAADGIFYAVTEFLDGETLRARLAESPIPVRTAVEYAIQVAEGLGAAHEKGIVHRDLKPENLLVTSSGRVKILDFGLARHIALPHGDETNSPTLAVGTEPGTVLGTVGYMSPEQVRGLPADSRSDIFSFGAVLYEMLSGRRAFKGASAAETMHAILSDDPPDLVETNRNLPPSLERIVRHCLEKRPEQRFHSAHDLAFDLQSISAASGTSAAFVQPRGVRARRTLMPAVLVATGLGLGALAHRTLGGLQPAEPPTYRRLTYDVGRLGHARFAADGNTVVYSAAWRGEPSEIFTLRLDSPESRSLGMGSAELEAVSSTSELAISLNAEELARGGATLARVPLAGGAPRAILEGVSWADWSPDGSELAVVRVRENIQRVEFPIGKVVYQTNGNLTHLRMSPRGEWLVVVDHPAVTALSGGSLIAINRDGVKRTLSRGWGDLWGTAWRPDAQEVWFTASRVGKTKSLWGVTLDGKERLVARMLGDIDLEDIARDGRVLLGRPIFRADMVALAPGTSRERDLSWLGFSVVADLSDDGDSVLFSGLPEGGAQESGLVYFRKTNGAPAVRLGRGRALALSPDHKWALCVLTGPARLVLLPTGAGDSKILRGPDLADVSAAAWFPDNRRVLFIGQVGGTTRGYVVNIEGGEPQAIGPLGIARPSISPDGRSIAAATPDGVVLFPVDGGESRPCAGAARGDWPIRWAADGRTLFVGHFKWPSTQIYRLEVSTGRRTLLNEIAARDPSGIVVPPEVRLSADGKSYVYTSWRAPGDLYLVEGLE